MNALTMPVPDPTIIARRDSIVAGLRAILPGEQVITSEAERRAYETDALTAYRTLPLAVVLPKSTGEVAAVLSYLQAVKVPVVPRAAGTSLAGGALPLADSVVVGTSKLSQVLDVNFRDRTARVQAGVTNITITHAVEHGGFFYAPDPSSQLACTIAGNIGMNSGGAHCLKYGVTTNNLLGVTMVLMDGTVLEIGGEYFDSPGYDFLGLTTGSEGQFGIITEAVVRIIPKPEGARPVLLGFASSAAAGVCVAAIIAAGILPVAIEYMDKIAIEISEAFTSAGYPLDVEALLIVEVEGAEAEIALQLERIIAIARHSGAMHVREAANAVDALAIWKGRKAAFGATGRISDYICMDGTIPTGQLPNVLLRITEICSGMGLRVSNIFHAGDGNLHPLILFDVNDPNELAKAEKAGEDILKLCVEVGGCLTGEHGVGIEKRDLMRFQFEEHELVQQARIKRVFDRDWLLNPGKVFPLDLQLPEAAL